MSLSPSEQQTSNSTLQPPKRNSPSMEQQTAAAPRKRRARYVWRACDVCRRRKGRCDGRKPCGFCRSRSAECHYTLDNDAPNEFPQNDEFAPGVAPAAASTIGGIGKDEPVSRLVLALQAQLDSLMAHVQSCNDGNMAMSVPVNPISSTSRESGNGQVIAPAFASQNNIILPPSGSIMDLNHTPPSAVAQSSASNPSPPKSSARRFYGPTSPDYSLNAAEIKLRQSQAPPGAISPEAETNPSLEDEHSEEEKASQGADAFSSGAQNMLTNTRLRQCFVQLPRLLARNETIRLLGIYQDVIGNLHPILDLERLTEEAESCYARNAKNTTELLSSQENSVLLLFLALAIALAAETVSQSYVGKTLYKLVEPLVKMKLTSDVTSLDHVLIALLAAIFHFFNDEIRLAWRVCGIAGRMAMELGLHRKDVHRHVVRDEKHHAEISALLWSIVILDRQWSAASGLPQNFQESDFDKAMEPPEDASYLRSMISYTFMSPKFESPIYHVAAGASYEQEDAFEVLNFQIDQWLKKAIEGQSIFHPSPIEAVGGKALTDQTGPASPVATLLYLRANAFRSIILRPFFFSSTPSHVTVKMIRPSMAIVSDSISVLSTLNSNTDVYRNQHPFFQHFLNSSCALLLLIIAYSRTDGNHALLTQSPDMSESFSDSVKKEVKRALELASAYSDLSTNSSRLTKRLRHLEEQVSRPDFLQPVKPPVAQREIPQRQQRNLVDRGNFFNGQMTMVMNPADMMYATEEFMGNEVLNGMNGLWWNDMEFLPNWPENDMTGHWM